jgi:hypothetical protein
MGDYVRVEFDAEMFRQRACSSRPFVPSISELKEGLVEYFQEKNPGMLECKFEKYMRELGHMILWTPPYTPALQPIELFWAAGKNHVASKYYNGITMKEVVKNLREGWYGSAGDDSKKAVNCLGLFNETIKQANKIFIPLCEGISGAIGNLDINPDYIPNRQGMPIDLLVMDVARDLAGEVEYADN